MSSSFALLRFLCFLPEICCVSRGPTSWLERNRKTISPKSILLQLMVRSRDLAEIELRTLSDAISTFLPLVQTRSNKAAQDSNRRTAQQAQISARSISQTL